MTDEALQVRRGIAWVGLATSFVALCDVIALPLILSYWASSDEYGTASLVVTMFGALTLVAEGGLPAALIHRAEVDEERLASAFWAGIAFACALYGVLFLVSPLLARAFDQPVLVDLFRMYGLLLLLRALYTTQLAVLRRQLRFKGLAGVRIAANFVEVVVKIGTAASGFGLWCFVLGPLSRELTYAIGVPLLLRWRPRLVCRPRLLAEDLRYGVQSNGAELTFQVYSNLDYQVVGYAFGPAAVGVYRAAYELVLEPVRFLSGIVTMVAFPAFARLRFDRAALVHHMVAFVRQNVLVVLPYVAIVTIAAEDLLVAFVGARYAVAADAARILALVAILRALSHLGPPLLDGLGRPDLTLRYQLTAATVMTPLFVVSASIGDEFFAVAIGWAVGYPIAFTVLAVMVLGQLQLRATALLAGVVRPVVAVVVATSLGALAHHLAADATAVPRLLITAGTVLGIAIALFVWWDGFSLRAIVRSLRG